MEMDESKLIESIRSWGGWLTDRDAFCLGWCLEDVEKLEGEIVEIGNYMGKSSSVLSYVAKKNDKKVICIDPFEWDGGTYNQFKTNLKSLELYDNVIPITTSAENVMSFWNNKIKFLFLDSDHDYDSCKRQFEFYKKYLVTGGIICFDDTEILDEKVLSLIKDINNTEQTNKRIIQLFPEYQYKHPHAWIGPSKVLYEALSDSCFELVSDVNGDKINAVRKIK